MVFAWLLLLSALLISLFSPKQALGSAQFKIHPILGKLDCDNQLISQGKKPCLSDLVTGEFAIKPGLQMHPVYNFDLSGRAEYYAIDFLDATEEIPLIINFNQPPEQPAASAGSKGDKYPTQIKLRLRQMKNGDQVDIGRYYIEKSGKLITADEKERKYDWSMIKGVGFEISVVGVPNSKQRIVAPSGPEWIEVLGSAYKAGVYNPEDGRSFDYFRIKVCASKEGAKNTTAVTDRCEKALPGAVVKINGVSVDGDILLSNENKLTKTISAYSDSRGLVNALLRQGATYSINIAAAGYKSTADKFMVPVVNDQTVVDFYVFLPKTDSKEEPATLSPDGKTPAEKIKEHEAQRDERLNDEASAFDKTQLGLCVSSGIGGITFDPKNVVALAFRSLFCNAINLLRNFIDWQFGIFQKLTGGYVSDSVFDGVLQISKNLNQQKADSEMQWVVGAWKLSLIIGSSFVGVLLLIAAFANILHLSIEQYGIRRIIPSIVLNTFMANISLLIIRFFVDVANTLAFGMESIFNSATKELGAMDLGTGAKMNVTQGIANIFGVFSTPKTGASANPNDLLRGTVIDNLENGLGNGLVLPILTLIFLIGVAIIVFILTFQLLLRIGAIYILTILAPLALIANAFPFFQSWSKKWWSQFWSWVFMLPAVMFILEIASLPGRAGISGWPAVIGAIFCGYLLYTATKIPGAMGGAVQSAFNSFGTGAYGSLYSRMSTNRWANISDQEIANAAPGEASRLRLRRMIGTRLKSISNYTNLYGAQEAIKTRLTSAQKRNEALARQTSVWRNLASYEPAYRFNIADNAENIRNVSNPDSIAREIGRILQNRMRGMSPAEREAYRNRFLSNDAITEWQASGKGKQAERGREMGLNAFEASDLWNWINQYARIEGRTNTRRLSEVLDGLRARGALAGAAPVSPSDEPPGQREAQQWARATAQFLTEKGIKINNLSETADIEKYVSELQKNNPEGAENELKNAIEGSLKETWQPAYIDQIKNALPTLSRPQEVNSAGAGASTTAQSADIKSVTENKNNSQPEAQDVAAIPPPTRVNPDLLAAGVTPTTTITPGQVAGIPSEVQNLSSVTSIVNAILGRDRLSPLAIRRATRRFFRFGFKSQEKSPEQEDREFDDLVANIQNLSLDPSQSQALSNSLSEFHRKLQIEPVIEGELAKLNVTNKINLSDVAARVSALDLKQSLQDTSERLRGIISEVKVGNIPGAINTINELNIGISTESLAGQTTLSQNDKEEFIRALETRQQQIQTLINTNVPETASVNDLVATAASNYAAETFTNFGNNPNQITNSAPFQGPKPPPPTI